MLHPASTPDSNQSVAAIITNFVASLQHQPNGDAVQSDSDNSSTTQNPPEPASNQPEPPSNQPQPQSNNTPSVPIPPAPPVHIAQPFPETPIVNNPPPVMPDGVEWPLKFSFEPVRVVAGPLLSDLSKAVKSNRRAVFLSEALARDNLPLWAYGLEPIPAHWITSENTKNAVTNMIRANARAVTSAVMSGMQQDANIARQTFQSRLNYIHNDEHVTNNEKRGTALALPWMEALSLNQINHTLHNQWTFLQNSQPSNQQIQNKWMNTNQNQVQPQPSTSNSRNNRRRQDRERPMPERRDRRPHNNNTTTSNSRRQRSRSRSPRPSTSRTNNSTSRTNNSHRNNRDHENEYAEFLEFKNWQNKYKRH